MKENGKTVTIMITFLLSVVFLIEYVTCPSTSSSEKVEMFDQLSKVIVRHNPSKIVHVYNNAALYSIRRPIYVTETFAKPNMKWFTIRGRKSQQENFRTLADMCGKEVELLQFTDNIVKMIFNEDYEYTLRFFTSNKADEFVNAVWRPSRKTRTGKDVEYELRRALIVDEFGGRSKSETIDEVDKLVQREISDQVNVYYVQTSHREPKIKFMLPSRHFLIKFNYDSETVLITPTDASGEELYFKYKLIFSDGLTAYTYFSSAREHQYDWRHTRDSEPQDTGNSDDSITHDGRYLYDQHELKCFRETETKTDWSFRNY